MRWLTPDARQAFLVLANAQSVCDSFVTSKGRFAAQLASIAGLRRIARDPLADQAFRELAETATPAGRLYGLAGLYHMDRSAFSALAERYASLDSTHVCIVGDRLWRRLALSEAVSEIAGGYWVTSLLSGDEAGRSARGADRSAQRLNECPFAGHAPIGAVEPRVRRRVMPAWPERTVDCRVAVARVELVLLVRNDGSVREACVADSNCAHLFDEVAASAARQWRFEPWKGARHRQEYARFGAVLQFRMADRERRAQAR